MARAHSSILCRLAFALGCAVAGSASRAQEAAAPPAAAADPGPGEIVTVRLVDAAGTPVHELESLEPVVRTTFDAEGTRTETLGERAVLWVRGAGIDGAFTFERFHEGKYINRSAVLEIPRAGLAAGEHVIQPGDHRFTVAADGALASADPEVAVEGLRIDLRVYPIDVLAVDGAAGGPPEQRLVAAELGLVEAGADVVVRAGSLPDPTKLPNLLSHARRYYPLRVYLPSNAAGAAYLLYPSFQAFRVKPGGEVDLGAAGTPQVPGVEADGGRIVIAYRTFGGQIRTRSSLQGGLGNNALRREMLVSPTLERLAFTAGFGEPVPDFSLPIAPDLSVNPNKFFLADNLTADPHAVRLLALEWGHPVLTAGEAASVQLRLLETPGKATLASPGVRVAVSPHFERSPDERHWRPVEGAVWDGQTVRFTLPADAPAPFCHVRFGVAAGDSAEAWSPLSAEMLVAVLRAGQRGTAAFVSNKGRNAFVAGETIRLQAVLRSAAERPAGERRIVLVHPDGQTEGFPFSDPGAAWHAQPFEIPGEGTRNLMPGAYELRFEGLPSDVAGLPFAFDLAGAERTSLYTIIKPSKYTGPMNGLIPSHRNADFEAIHLDRAVRTLAECGYNRLDLMTYDTELHVRPFTERERLAAADERLMAPASVYQPTPRNQLLNACVRHGLDFSDVFLSYNDFHLPRYVEGYIAASERWITREMLAMRHSPALSGMMLYDEMYDMGVTGLDKTHLKLFPAVRERRAAEALGKPVAKIAADFSKYVSRPASQRDPAALDLYLRCGQFMLHGWGDYNTRVADAARAVAPLAKMGTYHRTWMTVGGALGVTNGYPPDVFENLDIVAHVHYADNSTGWVHSSIMVPGLRFGPHKPVWINIPLTHEFRTRHNGEYQRHMAFAMLMQGADGVSQYGLPLSFENGPNPGTVAGRETTRHLNREVLAPFGELVTRTEPGYRGVAIVNTANQHLLSDSKRIAVANQAEDLWIACWRLGYPAVFLFEDALAGSVSGYSLIFVPGIKFPDELSAQMRDRLREAMAAGTKVVVEKGSELDLPGLVRLDTPLQDFYVRNYFPTWLDDELNKVFGESQPTTDYLRAKLPELGVEPAARGPFKVGPNWRTAGDIHYLVMANFEDPDYGYAIKQIMAKPVRMPLSVSARRGRVAYDLLSGQAVPLRFDGAEAGFEVDMTRCQGALLAFLPEEPAALSVAFAATADRRRARITASLTGASGKGIAGLFPVRLRLLDADGRAVREFYRVLGGGTAFEFDLPARVQPAQWVCEVREAISGRTVAQRLEAPRHAGAGLRLVGVSEPFIPYPQEVKRFLDGTRTATLIVSSRTPGIAALAGELAAKLESRGLKVTLTPEDAAYRFPAGDPNEADPMSDGFHSWRSGHEIIQPATVIDGPVILMSGKGGSYLLDGLEQNGFLTEAPVGGAGLAARPTIQVAVKGLHFRHDTLCLIANEAAGMRGILAALDGDFAAPAAPAAPVFADLATVESKNPVANPAPAVSLTNTNELVADIAFDRAGNLYAITWGHGNNLYSLDPAGKLRFSRHLPEAGAWRLEVADDRVLVSTAAGSRLYQLSLDGKPLAQYRMTRDPGPVGDDEYELSYPAWRYLPSLKQVFLRLGTDMRVVDAEGNTVRQWRGEAYEDRDVADHILYREPRAFVLSPDGTRLAQLETSSYFTQRGSYEDTPVFDTHLVLRDLEGKLLAEYKNVANEPEGPTAVIAWPAGTPGPAVIVKGEKWQFNERLELLSTRPYDPGELALGGELRLSRDGNALRLLDGDKPALARFGPFAVMPTYGALSPDRRWVALLDEYGGLALHAVADGREQWRVTVADIGRVLRFTPDSQRVLVGGQRGTVAAWGVDGKPVFATGLEAFNTALTSPALYDPEFPDYTDRLWPEGVDRPGDLEPLVRLGESRLENGACEAPAGWSGEGVACVAEGRAGSRCLRVGAATVSQEVTRYLGNHVTWVLEFHYRAAPGAVHPVLLAGMQVTSRHPDSVARRFAADAEWRFARLVAKSGRDAEALRVGFAAEDGEVLLDDVSLRQIRFPSMNHLHHEPLHDIEPAILRNPLFLEDYDVAGNLRLTGFAQVTVPPYESGGKPMVEPAFFHNGRLNDMDSFWYEQPRSRESPRLPIAVTLKEPRWLSHLAVYFNAFDAGNVTPHFDVYAEDVDAKTERLVASVRSNRRLFCLVRFPPVRASMIRLDLLDSISRLRTVTEIEVYGPLSGREGQTGFADPAGQNTYMGDFSRVDRRPKAFPEAFQAPRTFWLGHGAGERTWAPPSSQVLVSERKLYVSRALGYSDVNRLDNPSEILSSTRSGALSFNPAVTLYGGVLLKSSPLGRLYGVDAETGQAVWDVAIGVRDAGAPVVVGEDVYLASDGARLYKLDLANGSVMMDAELSGGVPGSLACDGDRLFLISRDGFLQGFARRDFRPLWKVAVAADSESTPAVDKGVVYVADRQGVARAVQAADGRELWTAPLGQEFTRCPVVSGDVVLFGCRRGRLAVRRCADGAEVWSKDAGSRFSYEPLVIGDEVLFFRGDRAVVAALADGRERELPVPDPRDREGKQTIPFAVGAEPLVSLSYYEGALVVVSRLDHEGAQFNYGWHPLGGRIDVLLPKPPPEPEPAKP